VKGKITTWAVGLMILGTPLALPAVTAADTHASAPAKQFVRSSWSQNV
jgi:hypothetical protein